MSNFTGVKSQVFSLLLQVALHIIQYRVVFAGAQSQPQLQGTTASGQQQYLLLVDDPNNPGQQQQLMVSYTPDKPGGQLDVQQIMDALATGGI